MSFFDRWLRKSDSDAITDGAEALSVREEMLEAFRTAEEFRLAREDLGWRRLGAGGDAITDDERQDNVLTARRFAGAGIEALSTWGVGIWTNFGIGTGVEIVSKDKATQANIDQWWKAPENDVTLAPDSQQGKSDNLLIDGELFLAIFGAGTLDVKIRYIDPLQMTIAYDPEDSSTPRFYIRKWPDPVTKGNRVTVYRDWMNEDGLPGVTPFGAEITAEDPDTPVVYFIRRKNTMSRGHSLLTGGIPWLRSHRRFMKSRVSIQQALATVARKLKVKGGSQAVTTQQAQHASTLASTGTETNPPPAQASMFIENLGASLENMKQETGAQAAQVDGAMLMGMVSISLGLFPHWMGAGESFRLATASAMETPLLNNFTVYNGKWRDIYRRVTDWILTQAGHPDSDFQVNSPPIVPADVAALVDALDKIVRAIPKAKELPEVQAVALAALDIDDAEEVLKQIPPTVEPDPSSTPFAPGAAPGFPPAQEPPGDPAAQEAAQEAAQSAALLRALARVREAREHGEGDE